METILRVFQVFLAIGLIGVVLLQRSEGGGLGIGQSGGMGSFMNVRGTANLLTRVTAILAALFMITCLALAMMADTRRGPQSIFDNAPATAPAAPASGAPASTTPAQPLPTPPAAPSVPLPVAPAPGSNAGSAPLSAPNPGGLPTTRMPDEPAAPSAPATPAPAAPAAPRGQ